MKHKEVRFNIPLPTFHFSWRAWLPSRGNVLFTLLVVAGLLWAQSVGALPLGRVANSSLQTSSTTIAYQGRLADADGHPLTGTYNMIFRLYDVPTGGTPLWEEQWTGSNGVRVSDGLFNVMLGSLNPIPQNVIAGHDQLWLGITVGTDNEMQPRVQLGSVPWAVQALTVPDGSITTAKIADGAVTSAKLAAENIEIRGDLVVDGDTESRDIRFGGPGQGTILRDDGSRSLHLLPWGGTGSRWDEVCIGCGSPANLRVHGSVLADNLLGAQAQGYEVRWGNVVVNAQDGDAVVRYARPFAQGTSVVVAMNGDFNAGNFFVNTRNKYADRFEVKLTNADGSLRNGLSRILYIAIGK